jgi:hypothetical protein
MKKVFLVLSVFAAALPALAVDNLIIIGHGSTPPSRAFGSQPPSWLPYLIPLIFLLAGLVHLFYPRVGWWFKYGWRFGGSVEPSSLWLFFERLGGVILIGVSVLLFIAVSGGHNPFSK